jgi:acetyl esterase/lipase
MDTVDWSTRPAIAHFGPASWQSRLVALIIAIVMRTVLTILTVSGMVINRFWPAWLQRSRLDIIDPPMRLVLPLRDTEVTRFALPNCPAEWVVAPEAGNSDLVIVYFHGSALVTLGLNSHRRFVSKLSKSTGARVLNVGYRLAPLATVDEAMADCLDGYRHALACGFSANRIVLAGDSAGGLLAASTAIAIRDAGLPPAAGQVLLSPLTSSDMQLKYRALATHRDALFPAMTVKFIYEVFATKNGTHPLPPMPPECDLRGLGPFLLQVGSQEMLVNDTFVLADVLADQGVPAWVQVWDRSVHMFQLGFDVMPDARLAVTEITDFISYVTTPAPREASA